MLQVRSSDLQGCWMKDSDRDCLDLRRQDPYNRRMSKSFPEQMESGLAVDRRTVRQTLFFDADDTLWENNIYFERAIAAFISYLDHRVHTREEVREHLNTCERATIAEHGYGLKSFRRSLIRCFEQLSDGPVTPEKHARIVSFAESIAGQDIELLPDVEETLRALAERHRLILVTKGNGEEQHDKLQRSGLGELFEGVEVPPEKNASMYRGLLERYGSDARNTWMIGNSPKSDINPALQAGLNTIFIAHDFTWVLEHEVLDAPPVGQHLLELGRFSELLTYL
jgi:putative hydrolase of the HAD superfamily